MASTNVQTEAPDLPKRARELVSETRAVASTLETTVHELETYIRAQMKEHPYATLGAAVGIGFVLGGGLPSRLTGLLLGLGGRVAVDLAAHQLGLRVAGNNDHSGEH